MRYFDSQTALVAVLGTVHGVSHFFQLVMPPLFIWIQPQLGLSFAQVGLVMTAFYLVSTLGQAFSGFFVDRYGARRVLLIGSTLFVAAAAVLATAQSWSALMAAGLLTGAGNCIFHPANYTLLNQIMKEARLPFAFSVHSVLGNLGWALAPVCMVAIAQRYDWQSAAWFSFAVALVSVLLLLISRSCMQVPDSAHKSEATPEGESALAFLRYAPVWLCFAFFVLTSAAFCILQTFAPTLLQITHNLTASLAALTLTGYVIGSAVGNILAGALAQKIGSGVKVVQISLLFSTAMALLLATGLTPGLAAFAVMVFMGFGVGFASPSRDMLIRRASLLKFGQRAFGRVYGFVYCGMDVGAMIAPILAGLMLDAGLTLTVLLFVAIFQGAAVLTVGQLKD